MERKRRKDSLVWGFILTVIGLIFLLENVNIDAWDYIWKLWPVVLIVWGAWKLFYGIKEQQEKPEEKPKPLEKQE